MLKIFSALVIIVVIIGGGYWFLQKSTTDAPSDAALQENYSPDQSTSTTSPSAPTTDAQGKVIANNAKTMKATLHTNKGEIVIEFLPAEVPNTVANFTKLAGEGFYNGTKFHRVIEGFMNQGGDPLSKDDTQMARWGTGGPGYSFADEITPTNANVTGTISMANAGPNTNGSQFFINVADNRGLDNKHTVFGKVVEGMNVVMEINRTPTDSRDRPITPVVIERISLQ